MKQISQLNLLVDNGILASNRYTPVVLRRTVNIERNIVLNNDENAYRNEVIAPLEQEFSSLERGESIDIDLSEIESNREPSTPITEGSTTVPIAESSSEIETSRDTLTDISIPTFDDITEVTPLDEEPTIVSQDPIVEETTQVSETSPSSSMDTIFNDIPTNSDGQTPLDPDEFASRPTHRLLQWILYSMICQPHLMDKLR